MRGMTTGQRRPHRSRVEIDRMRERRVDVKQAKQTASEKSKAKESFDFGPAESATVTVPSQPRYVCGDCKAVIQAGQSECGGCSTVLNWEGIG